MKKLLRELPAIDFIQNNRTFRKIANDNRMPMQKLTEWAQEEIEQIRHKIKEEKWTENIHTKTAYTDFILKRIQEKMDSISERQLTNVINATGTILHTNLGRARLSEGAIKQVIATAKHYSNLEYDLKKGMRGSRHAIIESLITELTGAEAAIVVNNNAAAVYLILRALAKGKEVIVSRGELVEIGGSFRVSSIMEESDALLKEVGTTNKTHLFDYEEAINENTAILMKVHTSNFKTIGFTHSVSAEELVKVAKQNEQLLVYEDLGSGALYDFPIGNEPIISEVVKTGVDLVSFSGDKLLGGPQAGIIVGKKAWIDKLKAHQLARVLRVDKMTLAALEATLKSYIKGYQEKIPTVRDILLPIEKIENRIDLFLKDIQKVNRSWHFTVQEGTSQVGGGTMPDIQIPTRVVAISHAKKDAQNIFDRLRKNNPPIISRMKNDQVLIDFRTIEQTEIPFIVDFFRNMD